MLREDDQPAMLARAGLNDTNVEQQQGISGKISRVRQAAPRAIDLMAKTMVFLDKYEKAGGDLSSIDKSSPEYATAVKDANAAFGSLNSLSPAERSVVARVVPMYPWAKTVIESLGGLAADNPAALLALNLGQMAAQNPNAFKQGAIAQEINPLSIFSIGRGAVNPFARAGVGAGLGFNLSNLKDVTHEGTASGPGALTAGQKGFFAANQILPTKALLASPLSGLLAKPLLGKGQLDQNVARYQSGQLKLSKGKTEPASYPPGRPRSGRSGPMPSSSWACRRTRFPTPPARRPTPRTSRRPRRRPRPYGKQVARLRARGVQ